VLQKFLLKKIKASNRLFKSCAALLLKYLSRIIQYLIELQMKNESRNCQCSLKFLFRIYVIINK